MKTTMLVLTTAVGLAGGSFAATEPAHLRDACVAGTETLCLASAEAVSTATAGTSGAFCFDAATAAAVSSRGANDSQVARAFESGACAVSGLGLSGAGHSLVRFSSAAAEAAMVAAYAATTAALKDRVTNFHQCYASSEALMTEYAGWRERWERFEATIPRGVTKQAMRTVIYLTDKGPRLIAEEADIRSRAAANESRCKPYQSIDVDGRFWSLVTGEAGGA
jgi:hypothetical protein